MAMVIYDSGDKCLERYTVFPYAHSRDPVERRTYLGMSEGGLGISMWGELPAGMSRSRSLGKIVKLESLSPESQRHIAARMKQAARKLYLF
jgi:hypothetical protein